MEATATGKTLDAWDYVVIVLYFGVVLFFGLWVMFDEKTFLHCD